MSDAPLEGTTALVTGASRGIGAEIARRLAGSGLRVALLARTLPALENLASEIGNGAFAVQCDVTDRNAITGAMAEVRARFGEAPYALINNAGLFTIRGIDESSPGEFESLVAANLTAPFLLVNGFLGEMRTRGSGHIVTIGSIADRHIFAGNAAYSATKFGARAIHEVLREETRGSGIRATLVSPASVDTDVWDPIHYFGSQDKPDRSLMLSPSAVAGAVLFALAQPSHVNIDELRLSRA
jgi:NADP-dependent 3-hydroxy acid dehydrogenase YdfG